MIPIRFAGVVLATALVWLASSCATSEPVPAGVLILRPAESQLYFIGIKNNAVGVPGSFVGLAGEVDLQARTGWLQVDAGSVHTGNPERDANITTHFFESDSHPIARFEVSNLPTAAELPDVGSSVFVELAGTLTIHGSKESLTIHTLVSREAGGTFRVRSTKPLILTAEQFGMQKQLAVLKAVCGHEALSGAAPVQFDVVFGG